MNKEEFIYTIKVLMILLIIMIPMIIFMINQEEKDYQYCIEHGYSTDSCSRE